MPTLVTGRASERSGAPTGRLARFCTRSKAYSPARSSSLISRSASGLVLGREGLLAGRRTGGGHELQGAVRRGRGAGDLLVDEAPRGLHRRRPLLLVAVDLRPRHRGPAGEDRVGPGEGVLQEPHRLEHHVGHAEREGLRGLEHAVHRERVLDDDLEGVLDADEVGQQVAAAPAGDQPEEALRQRDGGDAGGDRAVGAVEPDLHAAAHRGAVGEGERRHRQGGQLAERLVAQPPDGERLVPPGHLGHAGQVGSHGEDERLAGDADADDLAGLGPLVQAVQRLAERGQRGGAERVGLRVVEAVVQRDERERAAGQADVAHERAGHDLVGEGVRGVQDGGRGAHAAASLP